MSTTSAERLVRLCLLSIALTACAAAGAQSLYRYQDANGHWVFSDRRPDDGSSFDRLEIERQRPPGVVRLYRRESAGGVQFLAAENTFPGAVQIAFRIVGAMNLAANVPLRGNLILRPSSDTTLFELTPQTAGRPVRVEFEYQFIHGDPAARHAPAEPYRLPFALATQRRVTQAYPDAITHTDRANTYAIDFEMPVGTHVFAARGGVVLEVASDYFEAGVDTRLASRANIVRVLHEDGTIGLYAHLNWNSIRVAPGQRVERGEYIADSGNTGFSSGPHLHFVVQRNVGGEIGSVPVEFVVGGAVAELVSGDEPIAY